MMMTLFDEEQIARNHDESIRREEREKARKATKIAMEKANEQAIANIVSIYRQIDGSMDVAIQNIMKMYGYSEKAATAIVQKYWDEVPMTINIQMSKND